MLVDIFIPFLFLRRLPDHAQMRVLEAVGIFQTVAEHTIHAGVSEEDQASQLQGGLGHGVAQKPSSSVRVGLLGWVGAGSATSR